MNINQFCKLLQAVNGKPAFAFKNGGVVTLKSDKLSCSLYCEDVSVIRGVISQVRDVEFDRKKHDFETEDVKVFLLKNGIHTIYEFTYKSKKFFVLGKFVHQLFNVHINAFQRTLNREQFCLTGIDLKFNAGVAIGRRTVSKILDHNGLKEVVFKSKNCGNRSDSAA